MLNIVLFEPEKPANTGNIGRTCVAIGARLHLIEPVSFSLSDSHLKRAGMYHWKQVDVSRYADFQDFLDRNPGAGIYPVETGCGKLYTEISYDADAYLLFGKESPMREGVISMNLSDCVSIVAFEALRQLQFPSLK